ncbi:MAG: hypothetical protein AAGA05_08390 [Pseudomonadota bacterium]
MTFTKHLLHSIFSKPRPALKENQEHRKSAAIPTGGSLALMNVAQTWFGE